MKHPLTPYWIKAQDNPSDDHQESRIAIIPCPPGGHQLAGAIDDLRRAGIGSMVSLLSEEEIRVLGLEQEERLCSEAGLRFRWFPVTDHSIPESMESFTAVVRELQSDLRHNLRVGAHCFAGIGRSCTLMAALLCAEGLTVHEAFARLQEARGIPVPDTWIQIQWIEHFAKLLHVKDE
jgi:protein-tyrosine phosphatase